jgi:hypothetical protein
VPAEELADAVEEVACHPGYDSLRFVIYDGLAVDAYIDDEAAHQRVEVSHIGSGYTNPGILLVVVTANPHLIALAEAKNLCSPMPCSHVHVFSTMEQARQWIAEQVRVIPAPLGRADLSDV